MNNKSRLYIKGGHIVDPANGIDEIRDILIENGKIKTIAEKVREVSDCQVIDADGLVVTPGLIDMHTHLREPGREDKETIHTGTQAAVHGGFTSITAMPNTDPVNDNQAVTEYILRQATKEGSCHVFPVGAATKGLQGKELAEIGDLVKSGIVAITDDGNPIENAQIMRRALEYADMFNLPVISHCEDKILSGQGVMNEGFVSTSLGLAGIPRTAEEVMLIRDIMLAEMSRGKLHIAHVSTAGSVKFIREAKKQGVQVTSEVTPHHFTLIDEKVRSFDPNTKINPPLRTAEDILAIREGLADGTIDVIATDHAPHTQAEKDLEFIDAPFGIVGLETAVPLILTNLVHKGVLKLIDAVAKLTSNPAKILGIDKGTLSPDADADLTILDLEKTARVDTGKFRSKGKNTPFAGMNLKGWPVMTIVAGKIVFSEIN
jgi:dihydroorotase